MTKFIEFYDVNAVRSGLFWLKKRINTECPGGMFLVERSKIAYVCEKTDDFGNKYVEVGLKDCVFSGLYVVRESFDSVKTRICDVTIQ